MEKQSKTSVELLIESKKLTKEHIKSLKTLHGRLFVYRSDDGKYCILRVPTLMEIDACRAISGGSSIQFDMALVDNIWVEGDEEFKTVDKYRMGLFDWLGTVIIKVRGEMEEL